MKMLELLNTVTRTYVKFVFNDGIYLLKHQQIIFSSYFKTASTVQSLLIDEQAGIISRNTAARLPQSSTVPVNFIISLPYLRTVRRDYRDFERTFPFST